MSMIHDDSLADVLMGASADDVRLLIDVITDSGKGRVSLSASVCGTLSAAKEGEVSEFVRALVAEELSRFGGNSLMNMLRGGSGVPYKEMLTDVASHVGVPKCATASCADLEMAIIGKVVEQSLERMSEEDKATFFESVGGSYRSGMGTVALAALVSTLSLSALTSYRLAALVASATMSNLVGRGIVVAGGSTLARGLGVLAGPLGWAITGIWTAFDLASPAYRVTVPCVIQIGYMRQKMLLKPTCSQCGQLIGSDSKFCGHCGTRVIDC